MPFILLQGGNSQPLLEHLGGPVCLGAQPAACRPYETPDGYECGQHKTINLLKNIISFFVCVITCHSVFNVWPKTTLLPVWPRDAKSLDTPG